MPSKLDYLSKYMENKDDDDGKKKKKKKMMMKKKSKSKKKLLGGQLVVAHDDYEDYPGESAGKEDQEDVLDGEDRPVVVPSEEALSSEQPDDGRIRIVRHEPAGTWETSDVRQQQELPSGRRRYDSEDDNSSPPRRRHGSSDSEPKVKQEEGDNHSASRRRRRRRRRHDSSSPERDNRRERRRLRDDSDLEDDSEHRPHRRGRYDSSSEGDKPKPHSRRQDSDDSGDDRRRRRRYDSDDDSSSDDSKPRMSSGHKAGLQHYQDFNQSELKIQAQKQQEADAMVDKYGMGETVFRDKDGKRATDTKMPEMDAELEKQLNQGKVQREKEHLAAQEFQQLQKSSFARHKDDTQLEESRKNEIRKEDPMADYAIKQQSKNSKSSSSAAQPQRLVYKGPPPKPNRFGIRPGYRWDGVDRGNGFEDKLLAKKFSANRKKEEAYRWSSADM